MKKNIYIMYFITFLQGLVFYGPVSILYRQSRGLTISQVFILESVLVVFMLIFEVPWGYFADRHGYKLTLNVSFFIFFISKIIFYLAHSFIMFLLEALLISLAISGMTGCDSAIIFSSLEGADSSKVFSHYTAWGTAGFLAACLISTFLIKISLSSTALLTIFPYGIAFIASLFLVDNCIPLKEHTFKKSINNMLSNKRIIIFVVSMAIISESTHSVCIFLNQPQYIKSGIPVACFGMLSAFMQVVCILSAKSYKLSKKLGDGRMIILLFFIITLSSLLLSSTFSWFLSIVLIALIEASFALCQPLSSKIQNESVKTSDRATLLSMYAMAGDLTSSMVNLAIGAAAEASLKIGFIACGILSAASVILAAVYFNRERTI